MQSIAEIVEIFKRYRPDIPEQEATVMAGYLQQLKGCRLFSAAAPEFDKAEWLQQRTAGIGGSEIATILGENHWSTPRDVWMSKVSKEPKKDIQSEAARWGNLLEDAVATEWGKRENRQWIHIPVIIQDIEKPWMLANIDGLTLTDDRETITGVLEIKTTSEHNRDKWEQGPIPFNYICQATWYCGITRLPMFDIVCLVGGQKLYSYNLPFDEELFKREDEAAQVFWLENVQKYIEPTIQAGDKKTLVEELSTQENEEPVVLDSPEATNVVEAYLQIGEKVAALNKIRASLQAQIFGMMRQSNQAITNERVLRISKSTRRSCDVAKLEQLYPEAYNECTTTSVSTRLNIK